MKTTFIYALCEPGTQTIRYVGMTGNMKTRLKAHLKTSVKKKTHLGHWLSLLQEEGPNMIELCRVPYEIGPKAEMLYIRLARSLGMNLVNATDGGEGVTMTPEIRKKIGASNQKYCGEKGSFFGHTHSVEARALQSASKMGEKNPCFGRVYTPEERAEIGLRSRGKLKPLRTLAHCAAISAAKMGGRASEETKSKMRASQKTAQQARRKREQEKKKGDE